MTKVISKGAFSFYLVFVFLLSLSVSCQAAKPIDWKSLKLSVEGVQENFALACKSLRVKRSLESAMRMWQERIDNEKPKAHPAVEELAAITYYKGEDYTDINAYFRGLPIENHEKATIVALAKLICSGLNKMPESQHPKRTTYRGAWFTQEQIDSRYPIGSVVTEASFTSTSLSESIAQEFAFNAELPMRSVVFQIEHMSGVLISAYLTLDDVMEAEVLFLPGTRFRVKAIEPYEGDWITVKLVEVP